MDSVDLLLASVVTLLLMALEGASGMCYQSSWKPTLLTAASLTSPQSVTRSVECSTCQGLKSRVRQQRCLPKTHDHLLVHLHPGNDFFPGRWDSFHCSPLPIRVQVVAWIYQTLAETQLVVVPSRKCEQKNPLFQRLVEHQVPPENSLLHQKLAEQSLVTPTSDQYPWQKVSPGSESPIQVPNWTNYLPPILVLRMVHLEIVLGHRFLQVQSTSEYTHLALLTVVSLHQEDFPCFVAR
mmetsp:Transcript_2176/g.4575  ORF Transcript_2176/g.4575 Transcript_2176/m.4575 type:complete len:238 (+) Transcript_2176:222-935(+)